MVSTVGQNELIKNCHEVCREWRYSSALLVLRCGRRQVIGFTPRPLYSQGKRPVPTVYVLILTNRDNVHLVMVIRQIRIRRLETTEDKNANLTWRLITRIISILSKKINS
jgi:hypothetical protein